MAPKLTLYYFPIPARGDAILLCMKNAKLDYELVNIPFSEWPSRKASGEFPYDSVPVLEADGTKIPQTLSICRYIQQISDGMPSDPIEAALIDSVAEATNESGTMMLVFPMMNMCEEDAFKQKLATYKVKLPQYLKEWSVVLGEKSYFHGEKPGYADFLVWGVLDLGSKVHPDGLSAFPKMDAWMKRINEYPIVAAHERFPHKDVSQWI